MWRLFHSLNHLINLKTEEILNNKLTSFKKFCHKCSICLYLFIIFILIICELPMIYIVDDSSENNKENEFSPIPFKSYIIYIILFFIPVIIYFSIFYYSIIHHKYIQGDIIFGKNKSENNHFLKFLILILGLNNALIFHSVWVLNKDNVVKTKFSETFVFYKFYVPIEMSNNQKIDVVAWISFIFIIISAICSLKFSKLKIKGHDIFIFNENIDFFIGEEKFYGNFLFGCGCYIHIFKNYFEHLSKKNQIKLNDREDDKILLLEEPEVDVLNPSN